MKKKRKEKKNKMKRGNKIKSTVNNLDMLVFGYFSKIVLEEL